MLDVKGISITQRHIITVDLSTISKTSYGINRHKMCQQTRMCIHTPNHLSPASTLVLNLIDRLHSDTENELIANGTRWTNSGVDESDTDIFSLFIQLNK